MDGVDAGGGSPSPEQGGPTGRGSKARGARRVVSGVAVAAAVAVGGLTVAAVNPLGGAGAEEGTPTTEVAAGPASAPTTVPSPSGRRLTKRAARARSSASSVRRSSTARPRVMLSRTGAANRYDSWNASDTAARSSSGSSPAIGTPPTRT